MAAFVGNRSSPKARNIGFDPKRTYGNALLIAD
jgi:hypothetical protein